MAGRRRKQGRPRTIRRVRIRVARRPESEIDQHALALALIGMYRQIKAEEAKLEHKPGETPRKDQ
jgi:hypothetical protein